MTSATSTAIAVTTASAYQLVLTTAPPSTVTAGVGFGLSLTAEDQFGNVVTNYGGSVALSLEESTDGSMLGGTLTATPVNGVATFPAVTVNRANQNSEGFNGVSYDILATSGSLESPTIQGLHVVAGPARSWR